MKLKRIITIISALVLIMAMTACKSNTAEEPVATPEPLPVETEPTQGKGEGNKYTNGYFRIIMEFPEEWELTTTTPDGEVDYPYFQSKNDENSFASFRLVDSKEDVPEETLDEGMSSIYGRDSEAYVVEGKDETVTILMVYVKKDDNYLLCCFSDPRCNTVDEYQSFLNLIIK